MTTHFLFYTKERAERSWWLFSTAHRTRSATIQMYGYKFRLGLRCAIVEVAIPDGMDVFDFAKSNIHTMPESCILTQEA
jgi:hypothetical protein